MELASRHPEPESVQTALKAVFNWSYRGELESIRDLYARALDRQWSSLRDLDWQQPVPDQAFVVGFRMGVIPIERTRFWRELPDAVRADVSRRTGAFLLSNYLHGEQGALMIASQLVNAVPEIEGKLYAATQTLDEARHVEVFTSYIERLGGIQPLAPSLRSLLDTLISTDDWLFKFVGMQVVIEGIALHSFRDARRETSDPLLCELLTRVSRDEARHTAYGVHYLERIVPTLDARRVAELEDFALESCRALIESNSGRSFRESLREMWVAAGIDPRDVFRGLLREQDEILREVRDSNRDGGPLMGFVMPALRRVGLMSERIDRHFHELLAGAAGPLASVLEEQREFPEDLESWAAA